MSFAQIDVSLAEEHATDTEALLQLPSGEAASGARRKFGIAVSVTLVGAVLIFAAAPSQATASSSIDLPQSVISLDGLFTNPFYIGNWGSCPNDEYITNKEDCRKAGRMLGYDRDFKEELEDIEYAVRGCGGEETKKTTWSPSGTSKDMAKCLCKKKDMPDFAAMKTDLHKLTFHCINAASGNFGNFAACMNQIDNWSESDEDSWGDDESAEAPAAPENDPDADCWKEHVNKFSGGYARGESRKFDLDGAKAKCKEFGSKCGAVTCPADAYYSCTVRSSKELKPSDSGEVSYTYTC